MPNLNECQLKEATVGGDISALSNNLAFLSTQGGTTTLSWKGERAESANIIALEDVRLGDDVDRMLINQAKCKAKFLGDSSWYHRIMASGNRTSASDNAVQTLKSKGYTIVVNRETL